jgi:hypothetical protein
MPHPPCVAGCATVRIKEMHVTLAVPLSLAALLGVVMLSGCGSPQPIDASDSIYIGGDIITMNDGAVLNSAAMTKWNFSAETVTPPGGVIVRKPGTNEPDGLIMEMAYLPVFASLPQPTAEQEVE